MLQSDCEADSQDGKSCGEVQLFSVECQSFVKCFSLPVATKIPLRPRPTVVSTKKRLPVTGFYQHVTHTPACTVLLSPLKQKIFPQSSSHSPPAVRSLTPSGSAFIRGGERGACAKWQHHGQVSENTRYTMQKRIGTHVQCSRLSSRENALALQRKMKTLA